MTWNPAAYYGQWSDLDESNPYEADDDDVDCHVVCERPDEEEEFYVPQWQIEAILKRQAMLREEYKRTNPNWEQDEKLIRERWA